MPIDDALQRRFHLVDGIDSYGQAIQDPLLLKRLGLFMQEDVPYQVAEVSTDDRFIEGPTGSFRVRVYAPPTSAGDPRAGLVWAHGGGFVNGDLDMPESDIVSREISLRAGAVVVSVDYHLADGTASYPTLHQQVTEAVRWVGKNSAELGLDSERIFIGGASAGGNLAVAATTELRTNSERLPAGIVLAYPLLHRQLAVGPELEAILAEVPPLFRFSQAAVEHMFDAYLDGITDAPFVSLEHNNLKGFPPSLVILSEYDDLRPSGEAYAEQAKADGAPVETYLAEGMLHGHLNRTPAVPEVSSSLNRMARFIAS